MGLSTHVLDTALGKPAVGIPVTVEHAPGGDWVVLRHAETDGDGRCASLLQDSLAEGLYRIRFETAAYFEAQAIATLYPYVEIVFEVKDTRHHHIPLLLTANGYTTYRGS